RVVPFPSFFFSSRRRHTRFSRDWSSDVCSSDLVFKRGGHTRSLVSIARTERNLPDDTLHGAVGVVEYLTYADHADTQALCIANGEGGDGLFGFRQADNNDALKRTDLIAGPDIDFQHYTVDG